MSSDNVLVIPATFMVGQSFPANLPLADGSLKPIAECSRSEVAQAVEEIRVLVEASRSRLRRAYDEHVSELEMLAQVSAYCERYDDWQGVRAGEGEGEREIIWSVDQGKGESGATD